MIHHTQAILKLTIDKIYNMVYTYGRKSHALLTERNHTLCVHQRRFGNALSKNMQPSMTRHISISADKRGPNTRTGTLTMAADGSPPSQNNVIAATAFVTHPEHTRIHSCNIAARLNTSHHYTMSASAMYAEQFMTYAVVKLN